MLSPLAVGRDDWAGVVATHWERAGRLDRAVEWSVRAADAASAAGAYADAARYLSSALAALDPMVHGAVEGPVTVDTAELLLDLARVQYLGGDLLASLESCERAAAEADRRARIDVVARAAITIQGVGHPALNLRVERLCRRALDGGGADLPEHLRARVEAQLACTVYESDRLPEAISWSAAALTHAADSGDPDAELDAIRARAAVISTPGFNQELLDLGRRTAELAGPAQRPLAELWGQIWRSDSAIHQGNLAEALRETDQIRSLADRTGLPLARWHWWRRVASIAILTGDFARGREGIAEAATLAADWHDASVQGTHTGLCMWLALLRGDPADLPPEWTELIPGAYGEFSVARAAVAAAFTLVDRLPEASALAVPLIAVAPTFQSFDLAALPYLVDVALAAEDASGSAVLRTVLAERFAATRAIGSGTVAFGGSLSRIIGELDLVCGDHRSAVRHAEEGLTIDAGLAARPYLARGRLTLARALWPLGERDRAEQLARQALDEARILDMPGLVRQAEIALAGPPVSGSAAAGRHPAALTPREWEVAQLVGRALSNREVAEELVLSERTVESHVRNILAKADLRSRTDLARWILQQRS